MNQDWQDSAGIVNPAQRHRAHPQWGRGSAPSEAMIGDAINLVLGHFAEAASVHAPSGQRCHVHIRELQIIIIEDERLLENPNVVRLLPGGP